MADAQPAAAAPAEPTLDEMREALATVTANVDAAQKLRASGGGVSATQAVRLVAVSKTKSVGCLQNAYDLGVRVFGENYVQEAVGKAPQLPQDIRWHFIGHLQSNKAKEIVTGIPGLDYVETVDTTKLADKLNAAVQASSRADRPLNVLVQVNTSGEESKSGVEPEAPHAEAIAEHIRGKCPHLIFRGFMTIGMPDFTSTPANFECLAAVRKRVAEKFELDAASLELSMGMSGDYEAAIAMGSTNVRVGSTIFGKRAPKVVKAATPPKTSPRGDSSGATA